MVLPGWAAQALAVAGMRPGAGGAPLAACSGQNVLESALSDATLGSALSTYDKYGAFDGLLTEKTLLPALAAASRRAAYAGDLAGLELGADSFVVRDPFDVPGVAGVAGVAARARVPGRGQRGQAGFIAAQPAVPAVKRRASVKLRVFVLSALPSS